MAKLNLRARLNLTSRKSTFLVVLLVLTALGVGLYFLANDTWNLPGDNSKDTDQIQENFEPVEPNKDEIEVKIEATPPDDAPKPPAETQPAVTG